MANDCTGLVFDIQIDVGAVTYDRYLTSAIVCGIDIDLAYHATEAVPVGLLVAGSPCHIVVASLGGQTKHPLHRKLVPVLLKRGGRNPTFRLYVFVLRFDYGIVQVNGALVFLLSEIAGHSIISAVLLLQRIDVIVVLFLRVFYFLLCVFNRIIVSVPVFPAFLVTLRLDLVDDKDTRTILFGRIEFIIRRLFLCFQCVEFLPLIWSASLVVRLFGISVFLLQAVTVFIHGLTLLLILLLCCRRLGVVRRRITEANPRNSATVARIAEVNLVIFIPRLNGRDGQRYLTLVIKTFGGVAKPGRIDFPFGESPVY